MTQESKKQYENNNEYFERSSVRFHSKFNIINRLLGNIYNSGEAKPDKQEGTDHVKAPKNELHHFNQNCPNNQNRKCP